MIPTCVRKNIFLVVKLFLVEGLKKKSRGKPSHSTAHVEIVEYIAVSTVYFSKSDLPKRTQNIYSMLGVST